MEKFHQLLKKLDWLLISVAALLFFVILAVSVAEIIYRGFFGSSFLWTVDLCTILASWTMLLGAAVMVHRNDHLVVDILVGKLPPRYRRPLAIVVNLVVLGFFLILFFAGLQSAAVKMNMRFTSIGWRMGVSFYALPVFAFFSTIFMIERLLDLMKGVQNK